MKKCSSLTLSFFCLCSIAWAAPREKAVKDPSVAAKDPDFAIQGEYAESSKIGGEGEKGRYGLQVVALGDGKFQAALYAGGLPGSGAESNEFVLLNGETKGDVTTLKAKSGETVVITGDKATATKGKRKLFTYDRVERKSPTLGKKAPKGAKVLFEASKWIVSQAASNWMETSLKKVSSRSIPSETSLCILSSAPPISQRQSPEARTAATVAYIYSTTTRPRFSTPLASRGNSTSAALYRKKPPAVNMCLPPLSWQTYDIQFTAPRFKEGKKIRNARITTRHNGVVIHDDFELDKGTGAGGGRPEKEKGQIHLQGHGNPVRFQNIWLLEK